MIEQAHSNPFLLVDFSDGLGEEGIVVAESGERLAFRHGLIRDAEQASIPEAARTLDRHGAKVLPARRALSVEFATVSSLRVNSRVELASVAAGRRLDIARTGDARRRGPCHPGQQICRFLRWCHAVRTVARS